jgi:hypothetical protein
MTKLDDLIRNALLNLNDGSSSSFDLSKYIQDFRPSARGKAEAVVGLLNERNFPFAGQRPVFVSIGGGDGEEIEYLLRNTTATQGVLVEMGHQLAEIARGRNALLPDGKKLEVFEGDAKDRINAAIGFAHGIVAENKADYVAVSCHAVIHELFDRGREAFDPVAFFATVFSNVAVPTWFTYREPGVPEKWPPSVLLAADCSPQSILDLAEAICIRHQTLRELYPRPQIVGDGVRLNRTLAMEVLAKLFYLPDLAHEIEERSTSVDHIILTNTLWLAIGGTARTENRANITTSSAPTRSFIDLWQQFGVSVTALNEDSTTAPLAIAESQTRLIAWRLSAGSVTDAKEEVAPIVEAVNSELSVAQAALGSGDFDLLSALLISKGRAWIESVEKAAAIRLLNSVVAKVPIEHRAHLWSHYLLSIASLFAGEQVSPEMFAEKLEVLAGPVGLSLLFRAERMEFFRKADKGDEAIAVANTILPVLNQTAELADSLGRYVVGTCNFLLGSLLRYGGLYTNAWTLIDVAQQTFLAGVDSHDTELAHCYYAKAVCAAMTGVSNFDAPFDLGSETARQFAGALIQLSYSHAAWFVGNVGQSIKFASQAASLFESIGTPRYAGRAKRLVALLSWWADLESGKRPDFDTSTSTDIRAVAALTSRDQDVTWVVNWLHSLRPSKVLGLLQFAGVFGGEWEAEIEVPLPPMLEMESDGTLKWHVAQKARSLKEADAAIRKTLSIPLDRRVPLLAD